ADRNRSHWSTSKTPSYTKSVSWQHHQKTGAQYSFDSGLLLQKMITLRLRTAEPDYGNSW
ncbi:hypothetical protein D6Z84_04195, partial [Escherichia coli]